MSIDVRRLRCENYLRHRSAWAATQCCRLHKQRWMRPNSQDIPPAQSAPRFQAVGPRKRARRRTRLFPRRPGFFTRSCQRWLVETRGWVLHDILGRMAQFKESMKKHPPVPLGASDPYAPPKYGKATKGASGAGCPRSNTALSPSLLA